MGMLFNLLNQRNNAVINGNRKLAPFLKVQLPHSVMVNGKVEQYSPNHPYSSMDLEAINLKGGAPIDPTTIMKQPDPEWSPYDSEIRKFGANAQGNAKPTSTALQTILYDPKMNIVHYNFRGGSKTYHSIMNNNLFNRWITAPSIGKFWNKYLRNNKLPSAGEPTNGMPTTSASVSRSVSTPNALNNIIDNIPLPTTQWEILRMLLQKVTK